MSFPKKGRGRFKKLLPLCLNQAAQVPARQKETARQMCEHLKERMDGEAEEEGWEGGWKGRKKYAEG